MKVQNYLNSSSIPHLNFSNIYASWRSVFGTVVNCSTKNKLIVQLLVAIARLYPRFRILLMILEKQPDSLPLLIISVQLCVAARNEFMGVFSRRASA